ncbi:MAG TPA: DUF2914 domain-containing protein [Myxococcota bacterium]|nr:DUF2914 domain-containing protein [Myxococcota bacterium]
MNDPEPVDSMTRPGVVPSEPESGSPGSDPAPRARRLWTAHRTLRRALAVTGLAAWLGCPSIPVAAAQSVGPIRTGSADEAPVEEDLPSVIGQFTTGIRDREPIDQVSFVRTEIELIYFFTELRDRTDERIVHRWSYAGEILSEVPFEVDGPRWRVWSSKQLRADQHGDWTVVVVDEQGEVLAAETFRYLGPGGA